MPRSKLTQEIAKEIAKWVATGCSLSVSSRMAKQDPNTVNEWYNRGKGLDKDRKKTPKYAAFATEIDRAEAQHLAAMAVVALRLSQGGVVVKTVDVEITKPSGETTKRHEETKTAPSAEGLKFQARRKPAQEEFPDPALTIKAGLTEERKKSLVDLATQLQAKLAQPYTDPRDLPPSTVTVEALPAPPACQECQAATDLSPEAKQEWHDFGHPTPRSFPPPRRPHPGEGDANPARDGGP